MGNLVEVRNSLMTREPTIATVQVLVAFVPSGRHPDQSAIAFAAKR
jgi:hypothetical protein